MCHKPSGQLFRPPQKHENNHLNLDNSSLNKRPKQSGQAFRPPTPQCPNAEYMNDDGYALSMNDCWMGKTFQYGRGGEGGKIIFICLSVIREYLGRDLVMPNLPFPYDFESGRRLRAISGEFLEKTVFTFLGPSGLSWEIYCKHCISLALLWEKCSRCHSILRCIDDNR